MLLTIDVGNTNMVFGIYQNEDLIGTFRLMTDSNRTSDEIGLSVYQYFRRFNLKLSDVEDIIIASVVPPIMYTLSSAMIKYLGKAPLVVDDQIDPGLPYGVEGDERLGPDRAVACVAAMKRYGTPLIVLDFGTATTVDAISPEGTYMGGSILAGLRISTDALFERAALLPRVELVKPDTALGNTAAGQIQAGAVLGYIGAMEYLIRQINEEMDCGRLKVVATGGLARLVADNTNMIDVVDSTLILDGLRMIYDRYRGREEKMAAPPQL